MISLSTYISEAKNNTKSLSKGDIKFTIWEAPQKKVRWIKNNNSYQKIEYKLEDDKNNIYIDFLLGFKDNSWKLWIGKIGATSYNDDPYCSFDTDDFTEAITLCLDKVSDFVEDVKNDPHNWIQFYKNF